MTRRDDAFGDRGDLIRRLSLPENDFREALPNGAVVVDPGEAEVLERRLAQKLKEALVRSLRRQGTWTATSSRRAARARRGSCR